MLTKKQLIISCIFNGGNALFLIYYIYDVISRPLELEHITRWSYYLNSIFTTICLYCDIMEYFSQEETEINYNLFLDDKNNKHKNKIQELNDWNRNKYGVICNTLCYFVSIGFWSLFLFWNNYMLVSKSIKNVFNLIYNHCIIQIIIIVDLFTFKRKTHNYSWLYFGVIYSIFILYCIIICFEKYIFGRNAYLFMNGSSIIFLVLCLILSSLLLFICYLIHIYLIELKNKNENNHEKLIDERLYSDREIIDEGRL